MATRLGRHKFTALIDLIVFPLQLINVNLSLVVSFIFIIGGINIWAVFCVSSFKLESDLLVVVVVLVMFRPSLPSYNIIALEPEHESANMRDDHVCSSPWPAMTAHCNLRERIAARQQ